MITSEDRLRDLLARRADRVHSTLTISDIRDAGVRRHRHHVLVPALVAASVAFVVVAIALVAQWGGVRSVPPAGPGPQPAGSYSVSSSQVPTTTTVTVKPNGAPSSTIRLRPAPTVTGTIGTTLVGTAASS